MTVAHGSVVFYREAETGTTRWIVACQAEVLDVTFLRRGDTKPQLSDACASNNCSGEAN